MNKLGLFNNQGMGQFLFFESTDTVWNLHINLQFFHSKGKGAMHAPIGRSS